MSYKYKLSVCLCVKNEATYIIDFIKHYLREGCDHFYIINNNSNDNIEEVIQTSEYAGVVSLITDNRDMNILTSNESANGHRRLLNDNLYYLLKRETEWAIIVDADEFMYGRNGYTIKSYVDTIDNEIGCVYVIWNIINPCKDNNGNLTTTFSLKENIKRINYDKIRNAPIEVLIANDYGKSLIRTSMLQDNIGLWLHKNIVNGKIVNNYGFNKNMKYDNINEIEYSEANFANVNISLNHYAVRNAADYEKKAKQINVIHEKNAFIKGLFIMIDLDDSYLIKDTDIADNIKQ
jgi:hypothetical protein